MEEGRWFPTYNTQTLNAEARVCPQASSCGIFGGQSDTGKGFAPGNSVSPDNNIPVMLLSHSSIYDHNYLKVTLTDSIK